LEQCLEKGIFCLSQYCTLQFYEIENPAQVHTENLLYGMIGIMGAIMLGAIIVMFYRYRKAPAFQLRFGRAAPGAGTVVPPPENKAPGTLD